MDKNDKAQERLDRLVENAGNRFLEYASCAQGTLLALQEEFGIGGVDTLKAATVMPGIAQRGETCGAVVGALMALGLAIGREKPEDYAAYVNTVSAARKLCNEFEDEFGSCACWPVQEHLFGRSFNLSDPADIAEYLKAGAAEKCRLPVELAARAAGRIIIEAGEQDNDRR